MAEWLVTTLGYSSGFRRIFSGMSRDVMEADPVLNERVMRESEKRVYGQAGLQAYEATEPTGLRRLARRSLAQHLCQQALIGSAMINWVRRVLFGLAFLPLAALFVLTTLWGHTLPVDGSRPDVVVFFWYERLYKFVGDRVFEGQTYILYREKRVYFGLREIGFFLRAIASCPGMVWHPDLLCNFVRWLGYYGYVTCHYRPQKAVVHFFESTSSSSLMTAYLHEKGLQHIDLQHGEVLFTAAAAFCEFDEFRVWGEDSRRIFQWRRCPPQNIKVSGTPYHRELFSTVRNQLQPRPKRLLIIDPFMYEDGKTHYAMIRNVLRQLDSEWEVCVRRHPSEVRKTLAWMEQMNSDMALTQRGIHLKDELPTVPIEAALGKSRVVLGVASSALIEAWIAGCKVIHIAGGPCPGALMDRYQGSANVFYCDENCEDQALKAFLREPALLTEDERRLVNHVTAIDKQ